MKLNGIACTGYRQTEQGFMATLSGVDSSAILGINTDTLQITADDGVVMETFTGFAPASAWQFDVRTQQYQVIFPYATPESTSVRELQNQVKTLAMTVAKMQIGGTV